MIGTTVSRYRILSTLGGGGMGVVYEAEDTELGRKVAIKFLPESLAGSAEALERFKREARASSSLNHPHICTIYDVGTHEKQPFLVMERLVGQTLKHAIGEHGMPIQKVIALGAQIADALDAAHRAGIVHRDLRPANLFVTDRGEAKVLDFGLAKIGAAASGDGATGESATIAVGGLTEAGTALGTVAYMSPEQAQGSQVDARSDLFSFGVVLYQMATGRLPFPSGSVAEFFTALLSKPPAPPSSRNPAIPPRLEEIVLKALEKDPALRHQSAAGLRADLLRLERDRSGSSPPGPSLSTAATDLSSGGAATPRRRLGWIAAAVVAVLAGIGCLITRSGTPTTRVGTASQSAPEHSIAVLPFVDLSQAKDQEYFSDGIAEELLNLLGKIPELKVSARTSSFSFKGKDVEIPQIARQLHVANVLECRAPR